MKNLRTIVLCTSITLFSLCAKAQTANIPINEPDMNKPSMFANFPATLTVDMNAVSSLFNSGVGNAISLNLTIGQVFRFDGVIVSAVSKYNNQIQSIVLRSTNFQGASLAISKITDSNGTVSYKGRILSMGHGDLYELQDVNSQLTFVKKRFYDLVNE